MQINGERLKISILFIALHCLLYLSNICVQTVQEVGNASGSSDE